MKMKFGPIILMLIILTLITIIIQNSTKQELLTIINANNNELSKSIKNTNVKMNNILSGGADSVIDSISKTKLSIFNYQLNKLLDEIQNKNNELASIKENIVNSRKDLPDLVDLDKLNAYYNSKFKGNSGSEQFETSKGSISFYYGNYVFIYADEPFQLAYLRIGKKATTENSQLIKAWLDESIQAKLKLGYQNVYSTTKRADYGEYTEKLYTKGDLYFKTYFQYERVQGTYDSHSLQYTYYVEIGSKERKKRMELQQYVNKLGS